MRRDSIIRDWSRLRNWELVELVNGRSRSMTPETQQLAIVELARRQGKVNIYQMPDGDWGAFAAGTISDGFSSQEGAMRWAAQKGNSEKGKER